MLTSNDRDRLRMTIGARVMAALKTRTAVWHALAVAIALYGGLLRLDSFVGKYGPLDHPAWARIATRNVAPLVPAIRPSSVRWTREPNPYVGGDPINYIQYGRDMTTFYQPHVREPVFLAMTHAGLWALDDQDYGVSLASAAGSTLAIFATYLVGTALLSPLTGVLAALLTATELEMVTWGVDGWRDDTFMATILLSVWALLRLRERPSFGGAVLAGLLCGLSCLTRITAITFIVPAFLWLIVERAEVPAFAEASAGRRSLGGGRLRRERAQAVGLASLIMAIVVAPYLISCAIATGDPLISINYHTGYYRFAENRPMDSPMSAAEYLRSKFTDRPVRTLDTGLNGLFVQPFMTKWHGFNEWMTGFGAAIRAVAVVGLAALPFFAAGRLLLVALLGSLLPYIFTWNVGGGGAWRFTMHAYPVFFVAAAVALVGAGRAIRAVARNPAVLSRATLLPIAWRVAAIAAVAALGTAWYLGLPWYVTREAIAYGESTSIETGDRDRVFYRSGWSAPRVENITVRVSRSERGVVRLPLPARRAYDIVLRIDPVTPGSPEHVDVLFNRHLIGRLRLSWNPERVGSYRLRVRGEIVTAGSNELIVIPSSVMPAGSAGPRFAWLDPGERIGVRLWYVRVLP
jgi:Dolichyl-phosphate-mannose-protein mannosyltransferase